jgi:glycosyltransferase involved in cell wall biosynthesis
MNIVQINVSDYAKGGGGTIAMYRLYSALKGYGMTCKIISGMKTLNHSSDSQAIPRLTRVENLIKKITEPLGFNYLQYISSFGITKNQFYLDADILNFHIIHSGFFSYLALPTLTANKPAVFTLHDMWSFTGHCAYSFDCQRWQTGCGKCPYPNTYPKIKRDNTALEWKLKNWVYSRSNLTIVTPSRWLAEQAQQSMLNRFEIHHIPYGIDTDAYQPLDQQLCKTVLGISKYKYILMFGAEILKDSRKGGNLLLEALALLPDSFKADALLLTIGSGGEEIAKTAGIPHFSLDYVASDRLKSIAYSAADLLLFPTRADNLPLVLQESMACGTPMVSFNVGGVPDLVRPNQTGYLAEAENPQDFSQGIVQLLEDSSLREKMSQNCRAIALEEYPLELQAKRYVELYRQILGDD